MTALDSLRFVFVTGKGGVGKTVVTAALAEHLALAGKRVLLAITGGEQRFQQLLGSRPIEDRITPVAGPISAVLLKPDVALREYGTLVLKSSKLSSALFDNKYVQGFFQGAPGLKEWALLGKAWFHATENLPDGSPRFDVVLFDAPATGHGLEMLRVPKVIVEVAPPGVLRSDAARAWEFFRDESKSGALVVTLPEEMPTNETHELCAALREELGLPIAALVVNGLIEPLFDAAARTQLEPLADEEALHPAPVDLALEAAVRRALRERVQAESLARLRKLGLPEIKLPWVPGGVDSPESLSRLVRAFGSVRAGRAGRAAR